MPSTREDRSLVVEEKDADAKPAAPSWPSVVDYSVGRYGGTVHKVVPDGVTAFEPSGLAMVDGDQYVLSDDGRICRNDKNHILHFKKIDIPGHADWTDLESLATVPSQPRYLYVGVESVTYQRVDAGAGEASTGTAPAIVELDLTEVKKEGTAPVTCGRRYWILTSTEAADGGMEAMTFVPDGHHPYPASKNGFKGLFFVSSQDSATHDKDQGWRIDVYDLAVPPASGEPVPPGALLAKREHHFFLKTGLALADLHAACGDLWALTDDERGDEDFKGPNPDDKTYEKDYHLDPKQGKQRVQKWVLSGPEGKRSYLQEGQWTPPKVGCEALCFAGVDLLVGYDQSAKQAYRNDWHCPQSPQPPSLERARLPITDIWCVSYRVTEEDPETKKHSRRPTAFYNYVRCAPGFPNSWEHEWVETELYYMDAGTGAKSDLAVYRPLNYPEGFRWVGQVVTPGAASVKPRALFLKWTGAAERSPLREVEIGRQLWNDNGSKGKQHVRVWELKPKGGDPAYKALGVYFEVIANGSPGVAGYGAPPPAAATLTGLAALHKDFLREDVNPEALWNDAGTNADGPKKTEGNKPAWKDLQLWNAGAGDADPLLLETQRYFYDMAVASDRGASGANAKPSFWTLDAWRLALRYP